MSTGPVLFARYAYPPNSLGYCGPDRARELLERACAGVDDPDLRRLAAGFEGAWPYLELIAAASGIADPLDAEVVEAYWVGNHLLDAVTPTLLHAFLEDRFRGRAGATWPMLRDTMSLTATPHHNFHVFAVYPWVGLLRSGRLTEPLHVLDRCRIRWGHVLDVDHAGATVSSPALAWDGARLELGPERVERVLHSDDGLSLNGSLAVGDWVSLHWDWVCDRLDARRLRDLRRHTTRQLAVANAPARPAPAAVLG